MSKSQSATNGHPSLKATRKAIWQAEQNRVKSAQRVATLAAIAKVAGK